MAETEFFTDDQKKALRAAIDSDEPQRYNPYEDTKELGEPDKWPSEVEGKALDLAGNFIEALEEMPDLNQNQRKIAYFLAKRKAPQVVAAKCGVTASYVKQLKRDPRIKKWIEVFRGGEIHDLIDRMSPKEILDRASVRAAEVLAEKMNAALNENIQLRAALAILDRTGHGSQNDQAPVQINISQDAVEVYEEARQEAGIEDAEYEIVEDEE